MFWYGQAAKGGSRGQKMLISSKNYLFARGEDEMQNSEEENVQLCGQQSSVIQCVRELLHYLQY